MKTTEAFPPVQLDLLPRTNAEPTYRVYFRSDLLWAVREMSAQTPEQAIELAHKLVNENPETLLLIYEDGDGAINEIEVCDDEFNSLAVWYDDDKRLRLAARDLLDAAELVIARWESGDLAEAVRELSAAVARAKGAA
jgi:hypothetical protein